ncbi:hypothetical protein ABE099_16805 [Paenibacillus turicensis]|uniref:hypothetical protein n=1 Tax=Paenibacillus turicensis TaxID=160487 RepID=UPI003D283BA1
MKLSTIVQETVPNIPKIICPGCSSPNISFEYIGDIEKRQGYFLLWCNEYLEGIHISRIRIPETANVTPFKGPDEQLAYIPNFLNITP